MALQPIKPPSVAATNGATNGAAGPQIIRSADKQEITIVPAGASLRSAAPEPGAFDENLAELMSKNERMRLARRLLEYAEVDLQSRRDWEDAEKRGLQMMGLKDIPRETDYAPGVHKVVHPMLIEAVTQFWARAKAELFPPTGPVKCDKAGVVDQEMIDQADRVQDYMNYYLTQADKGYVPDSSQMLYYLPMSGSVFRKSGRNWVTGLPELRYVKATDFIAPYIGTDLASLPRYAHHFTLTGGDIRRAQEKGMFLDTSLTRPSPGQAQNNATADLADSRTPSFHDDDENYDIYEYVVDLELEADDMAMDYNEDGYADSPQLCSYLVVIEATNEEVLCVQRNWRETDQERRKKLRFSHHKLLPGMGFYGFGLPHVIGSLQLASSGSVNALLDAAFAANFQGGFKTKSGKAIAGETRLEHGVWVDVDASYEDLAKAFYTPPFKEPSNALSNLLGMLVEAGRRFAGTMDIAVGDQSSQNAPVGTTLALIEQAHKPQSAIHADLHFSIGLELQMLAEDMAEYLPDEYPYTVKGKPKSIFKADFDGRVDIIPVSDPNIYSSTQRIAVSQGVLQLQQQAPDLYSKKKRVAAHKAMLSAMRAPDADSIGPDDPQDARYLDPVTENGMMFAGQAVQAYPTQDHLAHMAVVENGIQWAQGNLPDDQFGQIYPQMMAHYREHLAMHYTQLAFQSAGVPAPPLDDDGMPAALPPDIEAKLTSAVVRALPPPPMSQQQQQKIQQEQSQVQDLQGKSQAEIQATQAKTQAQIAREDALAQAKLQRETRAFAADQVRKGKASNLDEARKDQTVASGLIRQAADAKVKRQNLAADHSLKHVAAKRAADIKIDTAKESSKVAIAAKKKAGKVKPKKTTH